MITSWEDFEEWRSASLAYHNHYSMANYSNALTYFEYAREYFNKNGFPTLPKGRRKWKIEEIRKQRDDINKWIRGRK